MTTAVERFLKYVSYDTQSDEAYDTCPSTKKQLLLANELKRELEEMGASDVRMSEYGYLFARIPDNTGSTSAHGASGIGQKTTLPALGFISHMHTSTDTCLHAFRIIQAVPLHCKKRKLLAALRLLTVHPALDRKPPSRHLASFPTWTPRRP